MIGQDLYRRHVRILAHATASGTVIFVALVVPVIVQQSPYLQPATIAAPTIAFCVLPVALSPLALFSSVGAIRMTARIHTVVTVALIALWVPAGIGFPPLPGGESPWILQTFGVVAATGVLGWSPRVVWIGLPLLAAAGGLLRFVTLGSGDAVNAVLESINMFSFSAVIATLMFVVLAAGRRRDELLNASVESARHAAEVDSRARLRAHLGTLVHDDIIATLVFAARPDTSRETSAASARDALASLARFTDPDANEATTLTSVELEHRLRGAIAIISETATTSGTLRAFADPIPRAVAAAIEGALVESVRNAIRHTQPDVRIRVTLVGTAQGIGATVEDNGPGFREADIPPYRFGLRLSVIDRLHRVPGGSVLIDSAPGRGTRVHLLWDREAVHEVS